jgi:hypothetical protein
MRIDRPTTPFARLTRLDFRRTRLVDGNENDCDLDLARSLFSPAQFPALRTMRIDRLALGEDLTRFILLLPQLSDIQFFNIPLSLIATQLPHCTSLKKLRILVESTEDPVELLPFYDSLRELHLEEFRYWDWGDTDGEVCLDNVRRVMAIVGEMKTLKKLSLGINKINTNPVTKNKWSEFKQDVKKICEKNKVEIVSFFQEDDINELIWVD